MLKKIEALRKQPRQVRNRYAFFVALGITLCILVVWGSTLPARFAPVDPEREIDTEGHRWGDYKAAFDAVLNNAFARFGSVTAENTDEGIPDDRIDFAELIASSTLQEQLQATNTPTSTPPHTASSTASSSLGATATATSSSTPEGE